MSAGKLIQKGFKAVLDVNGSYFEKNGRRVPLVMREKSFYYQRTCVPLTVVTVS